MKKNRNLLANQFLIFRHKIKIKKQQLTSKILLSVVVTIGMPKRFMKT